MKKKLLLSIIGIIILIASFMGLAACNEPSEETAPPNNLEPTKAVFLFTRKDDQYTLSNCYPNDDTEIIIPSIYMKLPVTKIDNFAIRDCTRLTKIIIPDTVKSIGFNAFINCSSLKDITIGNNVNYIGMCAFRYCDSLSKVYYKGSIDAWNKIKIKKNNEELTEAARYYYSETQPTDTQLKYWHYDKDGVTIKEW